MPSRILSRMLAVQPLYTRPRPRQLALHQCRLVCLSRFMSRFVLIESSSLYEFSLNWLHLVSGLTAHILHQNIIRV